MNRQAVKRARLATGGKAEQQAHLRRVQPGLHGGQLLTEPKIRDLGRILSRELRLGSTRNEWEDGESVDMGRGDKTRREEERG
jgi:hypothetical protein